MQTQQQVRASFTWAAGQVMGAAASLLFFLSVLGRYQPTPPRWRVAGLTHTVLAARVKRRKRGVGYPWENRGMFWVCSKCSQSPLLKLVNCFKLIWEHVLQKLKFSQQRTGALRLQGRLSNRFSDIPKKTNTQGPPRRNIHLSLQLHEKMPGS